MTISGAQTKQWRDKIEVAIAKAQEALDACEAAISELVDLGETIEEKVDYQSSELEAANNEVAQLENE